MMLKLRMKQEADNKLIYKSDASNLVSVLKMELFSDHSSHRRFVNKFDHREKKSKNSREKFSHSTNHSVHSQKASFLSRINVSEHGRVHFNT